MVSVSDVQDVNDNPPMFEQNEYTVKVVESTPNNSQVCIYFRQKKNVLLKRWHGAADVVTETNKLHMKAEICLREKFQRKLPSCRLSNRILFMAFCKRVYCTVTNEQREIIITAIFWFDVMLLNTVQWTVGRKLNI